MGTIRIENLDVAYEVEAGVSILEANLEKNVDHEHDCGGNCACSTCKISILSGGELLSPQEEDERDTLDAYGWDPDEFRLACQCIVKREGEIVIHLDPLE
ncbi:MAG: 2Fe-2S iron-sulfur cluster-binding protein [bacterium]